MSKSEIKMILKIILVGAIIFGLVVLIKNAGKKEDNKEITNQNQSQSSSQTQVTENNGIKENTNDKLTADRNVNGMKISGISVTESNGVLQLRANITNETGVEKAETPIKIKLKNKDGEVIQQVGALVGRLKAGETKSINASVNMQIDEIYDAEFSM